MSGVVSAAGLGCEMECAVVGAGVKLIGCGIVDDNGGVVCATASAVGGIAEETGYQTQGPCTPHRVAAFLEASFAPL